MPDRRPHSPNLRAAIRKKVVISARLQDLTDIRNLFNIRTSEVTISYPTPHQQQQPNGDGAAGEQQQQQPQLSTMTGRAVQGQPGYAQGQQDRVVFPMVVAFDAVGSEGQEVADTPFRVVGRIA